MAPEGPLRGTLTNPMKKGAIGGGVFSVPSANGIGDTYVGSRCSPDPGKLERFSYVNGTNAAPQQFRAWKNNDVVKTV